MLSAPFFSATAISAIVHNRQVVAPIDLLLSAGEKLAIVGETGSGKSTLLKMMAGLVQPATGTIYMQGKPVIGPEEQLIAGHPHIAYLSQHYHLHNNYQVSEIIDYGSHMTLQEQEHLLQLCHIAHLAHRKTNSGLSGGEKQRIALAKLLAQKPKLLLLDEPYSNLDAIHKLIIKKVIRNLENELGITCVMVSHDAADVLSWADRIMVLQQGKLVQQETPEALYHTPANVYAAALFGPYTLVKTAAIHQLFPNAIVDSSKEETILRPSFWQVSIDQHSGIPATVTSVEFLGYGYLMNAQLQQTSIVLQTTDSKIANATLVFVQPAGQHSQYS